MKPSTNSRWREGAAWLWSRALWVIFALVLLIPKLNRLRRRKRAWNIGRLIAGVAGAIAIVLGTAREHKFAVLVIGAVTLFLALLLPPERQEMSADERARQLGASIMVNGGCYVDAAGVPNRARLFVGSNRLWVVDPRLQVLTEIPLQQVANVFVQPAGAGWKLRLEWNQMAAEFLYEGSFGEDLARVAEATIRGQLHGELPVLQ